MKMCFRLEGCEKCCQGYLIGLGGNTTVLGSWDLVSKVISTLIGVISIVTLMITLVAKSHDPLSKP